MKLSEGVEAAIHCAAALASGRRGHNARRRAWPEQFGLSPSYLLKHLNALTGGRAFWNGCGAVLADTGWRVQQTVYRCLTSCWRWKGAQSAFRCGEIRQNGPVKLDKSAYVKPCGINAAMLRAEKAYRAALAAERLSDIGAKFHDPRPTRARSPPVAPWSARRQRPQKSVSTNKK